MIKAPEARPTGKRFLILVDDKETVTEAGIFIPKPDDSLSGTIVRMPEGVTAFHHITGESDEDGLLDVGTRVMWKSGTFFEELTIDGIKYFLSCATDIACTLPGKIEVVDKLPEESLVEVS